MYDMIIWATDGSERADVALAEALDLAELSGGHVVAVHCDQRLNGRAAAWPMLPDEDDLRIKIRRQVDRLRNSGVNVDIVVRRSHREAADVVAGIAAELDADLVVCGTRGLGALSGAFLGSFTQRLLQIAPCPILAVHERNETVAEVAREKLKAGA